MSQTPQDNVTPPLPVDPESADDFEILEVVGLDEDGIARPAAEAEAPEKAAAAQNVEDVEIVFEDDATAGTARSGGAPSLSAEDVDLRERLLRLHADFENHKKRVDRERMDHFRYATFGLVGRILPVIDNFERAIAAARPGAGGDALIEGLELIHRQLLSALEGEGLHGMNSLGELFDPERHEAVATDLESPVPAHTVTEEFRRGYFLHDRVLRPAMVRVRVDASEGDNPDDDGKES